MVTYKNFVHTDLVYHHLELDMISQLSLLKSSTKISDDGELMLMLSDYSISFKEIYRYL